METTKNQHAVLVFTDLVDSVKLQQRMGAVHYSRLKAKHDRIFKAAIHAVPGAHIVESTGDGFYARFPTCSAAIRACLQFQYGLSKIQIQGLDIKARVGIHCGEIFHDAAVVDQILGMVPNITARVMALALPGQVLMTGSVYHDAVQYVRTHPAIEGANDLPALKWMNHGQYLLKGYPFPFPIFEVGAVGIAPLAKPPSSEKSRRVHYESSKAKSESSPKPWTVPLVVSLLVITVVSVATIVALWLPTQQAADDNLAQAAVLSQATALTETEENFPPQHPGEVLGEVKNINTPPGSEPVAEAANTVESTPVVKTPPKAEPLRTVDEWVPRRAYSPALGTNNAETTRQLSQQMPARETPQPKPRTLPPISRDEEPSAKQPEPHILSSKSDVEKTSAERSQDDSLPPKSQVIRWGSLELRVKDSSLGVEIVTSSNINVIKFGEVITGAGIRDKLMGKPIPGRNVGTRGRDVLTMEQLIDFVKRNEKPAQYEVLYFMLRSGERIILERGDDK